MMNKLLFVFMLILSTSVASVELPDIKEGLWEVSSVTNIPAMPIKMPAMKIEQCFTKANMQPENILQQNNCTMNSMDIQNNLASWSMSCEQDGMTMQGEGKINYQKTRFSGTFDMTMSGSPQGAMTIQTKLTGRYIGVCP